MLQADRERRDADRFMAAQHAVWMQAAVVRAVGMVLGSRVEPIGVWDLVPHLEPATLHAKRMAARAAANEQRWKQAAGFLTGSEWKPERSH